MLALCVVELLADIDGAGDWLVTTVNDSTELPEGVPAADCVALPIELPEAVTAADCVALPIELPEAVTAADCVALPTELPDAVPAADCVALPTELPEAVMAADSTADSDAIILGVKVPTADTVKLPAAVTVPTELLDTLVEPLTDAEPLPLPAAVGLCAALAEPVTLPAADSLTESVPLEDFDTDPDTVAVRVPVLELLIEPVCVAPTLLVAEPDEDRVPLTETEGDRVPETLAVELLLAHPVAVSDFEPAAEREAVAAPVALPDIDGVIVGATVTVRDSIGESEALTEELLDPDALVERDSAGEADAVAHSDAVSVLLCVTVSTRDVVAVNVCPPESDGVPETVGLPTDDFVRVGVPDCVFVGGEVAEILRDIGAVLEPSTETDAQADAVLVLEELAEPEREVVPVIVLETAPERVPLDVALEVDDARAVLEPADVPV